MSLKKKLNVLLIDESNDETTPLAQHLESLNVALVAVATVDEAQSAMRSHEFAAILWDVHSLAQCDAALQTLHQNSKTQGIPVIFLADSNEQETQFCYDNELTQTAYHIKPINFPFLRSQLAPLLDCFRHRKTIRSQGFELRCETAEKRQLEIDCKRLQEKVRQCKSMQSVGTLISNISHEFNNILGYSQGFLTMGVTNTPPDSKTYSFLNKAKDGLDRAVNLIKQMQIFSCERDDKYSLALIQSTVKRSLKDIRIGLPEHIKLESSIDEDSGSVMLNDNQIQQLLMLICDNAVHSIGSSKGKIHVLLDSVYINKSYVNTHPCMQEGSYVRICICDTGHGMNEETKERIFEPFFSTKPREKGMGLGLPIAHGIVENHNGEITVHSDQEKGSTFIIYLPEIGGDVMDALEKRFNQTQTKPKKVLFIEDDDDLGLLGKSLLEYEGYSVTHLTRASLGWQTFNKSQDVWDYVFIDKVLSDGCGLKLAEKIHSVAPQQAIIVTTNYNHTLSPLEISENGINTQIMKPYGIKHLKDSMQTATEHLEELKPETSVHT